MAAKNLSGLITRVNQYRDAIKNTPDKTANVHTALAAKNLSGLISKIGSYNNTKISEKTVKVNVSSAISQVQSLLNKINALPRNKTVTVKVNQSGSVPKIATGRSIPNAPSPQGESLDSPIALASNSELNATSSSTVLENNTGGTPQLANYSKPIEVINKGYNYFIELENQLKKINNQLSILDTKMENAFGVDKINYLNQQINLYKEQRNVQQSLINDMTKYQSSMKSYLSGKGFKFDSIGNITNYHTKLIAMERELERLETIANKDNATDKQKKAYENYKNNLDEIKKVMSEYMDITFTDLPKAQEEWNDLANSITDTTKEIEEIKKKHKELINEAKVYTLTDAYKDLEHELNKIDKLLENANGQDKINLLNKQLEILQKQKEELKKQESLLTDQKNVLKNDLSKLGFTFDSTGDITNYAAQLDKLFNQGKDIDEVTELLDKYFELQNDRIPEIAEEWLDLDNAIKDVLKEQLETTSEVEKKITEIYKKQVEERISQIEKESDAKIDAIKKQQDAYNKYREEVDYKDEYEEKLSEINDIQKQLDIAMRDTSLQGQKKVQELQKLLADAQKELDKFTQDKIDSDINDAFDKEINNIEETNKNAIESLEKEWSESKIAEMVSQAISTGIFEGIDGKVSGLQDAMLEFAQETGELFGVMGTVIKSELITNLDIAMDTFRDLGNIIKNLDLEKFSTLSRGFNVNMRSMPSVANSSPSLVLNAPMIHIEGNADKDVIEDLKSFGDKIVNDVINKISSSIR